MLDCEKNSGKGFTDIKNLQLELHPKVAGSEQALTQRLHGSRDAILSRGGGNDGGKFKL